MADIDIDFIDKDDALEKLNHIRASITRNNNEIHPHISGAYFQNIPYNFFTNLSLIDYKKAEQLGYLKIDFLNNTIYQGVKNEEHLIALANKEPNWSLLENEDVIRIIPQLSNWYKLLIRHKPKSIEDLAIFLALIRPSKSYLKYSSWDEIKENIWKKEQDEEYQYKKSHAVAFAMSIVVFLNLLEENGL